MTKLFTTQREQDILAISKECQKIGHQQTLANIQKASRIALVDFPTDEEINRFPPRKRRVFNRIRDLLQAGCECSNWQASTLADFLNEVSWGVAVADAVTAFLMQDNNGGSGGEGESCSTKARKVYDKCVNDEGCDTDCWICLCESTCSLEYISSMVKCLNPFGA